MKTYNAILKWNRMISSRYFHLRLECPELASTLKPGQFINLRCNTNNDPFLRRPFSVYRILKEEGQIELVILLKGKGTNVLAKMRAGDKVNLLGPLGNHYPLEFSPDGLILLGRGVGMASVVSLAEEALQKGFPVQALVSARKKVDLIGSDLLSSLNAGVFPVVDDDGTSTLDNVEGWLKGQLLAKPNATVVTCGSNRMGKLVAKICHEYSVPGYISLEAHMACGFGVCYGCVCKTENGYQTVCKDGPVFPIGEVKFDEE